MAEENTEENVQELSGTEKSAILMMLLGIQVLTTGLVGEMITFKNFRSSDTYSVKERVD